MASAQPSDRLDSWKSIAAYLRRTERTARRWEQTEGLPVHRLVHQERSSIYAFKSELDTWLAARGVHGDTADTELEAGTRRRAILVGAAALLVALGVAAYWLTREMNAPAAPYVTLAVLPFASDELPEDDAYLGPAVAETIVERLARAPDLRVRPFASSLRHFRPEEEPSGIGRRMGVEAVATGRVIAAGERLSIHVALVDVTANAQFWGDSYTVTYADLGELEQRIAHSVREQVLRHRYGASYEPVEFVSAELLSSDPEAMRHFLRGVGFSRNPGRSQIQSAIDEFRAAVERDPDFAAAHSALAIAYVAYTYFGEVPPKETMALAKASARRGLSLDPQSFGAHMALAGASHWHDFDHAAAERHFHAAIAAAPGEAGVRSWYAEYLIEMLRFDDALAANRAASERDPGWLEVDVVRGNILLFQNRAGEAIPIYVDALKQEPSHGLSHYFLGQAYLATGRDSEAIKQLELANQAMGDVPFSMAALAFARARAGQREEAERMLRDFQRIRDAGYYPAFAFAMVHAGLENREQALDWLERATDEGLVGYYLPSVELAWITLRGDARFRRVLSRLRLPERT